MIDMEKMYAAQRIRSRRSSKVIDFRPLSQRLVSIAEESAVNVARRFEKSVKQHIQKKKIIHTNTHTPRIKHKDPDAIMKQN